jgi:hypothetical protein
MRHMRTRTDGTSVNSDCLPSQSVHECQHQRGSYAKAEAYVDTPSVPRGFSVVEGGGHCAIGNVFDTRQHMRMEGKKQPYASFLASRCQTCVSEKDLARKGTSLLQTHVQHYQKPRPPAYVQHATTDEIVHRHNSWKNYEARTWTCA